MKLNDVSFAKDEVERILPLFNKFCKDKVKVLINPNNVDIDDYFSDIAYDKARKLRKDEDGKAGCALLFHYVGHGATVKQYTCMLLN